jgi:3-oxoadipate enol-lactonase
MPGYGQSPPVAQMTFPVLGEALAGLLDARGIERAVLVGHSMGGMVAQELAASRPDRVAALVLVATSPSFGSRDGEWQKRFLAERLKPIEEGKTPADIAPGIVANLVGDDPDPRGVARAIECMSGISAETYRAALHCLLTFDRRASLAAIRCPTIVIAGERDRVVALDVAERMALAIPGAVFHTIPGCGHLTNLERPEAFGRALEDFLDVLG